MDLQTTSIEKKEKNRLNLRSILLHPKARDLDVDGADRVGAHREMLREKPSLKAHFDDWYKEVRKFDNFESYQNFPALEIGAGPSHMDEFIPNIIKSDVIKNSQIDRVEDAMNLTFEDSSLRGVYCTGTLHHISFPSKFFHELDRVLIPGGRFICIEPNNTFPQKILVRLLDHWEYFDTEIDNWNQPHSDVMSSANLVIPWVIFHRDRKIFEKQFPNLKIIKIRYHSLVLHLLSGGLSFKSMIPSFMIPIVRTVEWLLSPVMKTIGTSFTVVIEKIPPRLDSQNKP